jgi:hypothetical protein
MVFLTVNLDDEMILGKISAERKIHHSFSGSNSSIPKELYSGSIPTTTILDKTGKIRMHHSEWQITAKTHSIRKLNSF